MGQRFCGFSTPVAAQRATAVWIFSLASTLLLSATGLEGKTALLIIDVQNDFLPGGSLAVKEGPVKVVPVINELLDSKENIFDYVLASQDWHPKVSFPSLAGRWGLLILLVYIIFSACFLVYNRNWYLY
jgi:hypothetical protein